MMDDINATSNTKLNDTVFKDKTFIIKIKYQQNYSIQGSIQWVDSKKTVNFRSMMELIMLINESVEDTKFRSWKGEEGVIALMQSLG